MIKFGGCQKLSQLDWSNLIGLNLGKATLYSDCNNIGTLGCDFLSLAKWPLLETISLSKLVLYLRLKQYW